MCRHTFQKVTSKAPRHVSPPRWSSPPKSLAEPTGLDIPEQPASAGLRSKTTREHRLEFHHTAKFTAASIYAGHDVGQAVMSATFTDFGAHFQMMENIGRHSIGAAYILSISQLRPFFRRRKNDQKLPRPEDAGRPSAHGLVPGPTPSHHATQHDTRSLKGALTTGRGA